MIKLTIDFWKRAFDLADVRQTLAQATWLCHYYHYSYYFCVLILFFNMLT